MSFATIVNNACKQYGIPDKYREYLLNNEYIRSNWNFLVPYEEHVVDGACGYYDCDFFNKDSNPRENIIYRIISEHELFELATSRYDLQSSLRGTGLNQDGKFRSLAVHVLEMFGVDADTLGDYMSDKEYWERLREVIRREARRIKKKESIKVKSKARTISHISRKMNWRKKAMPLGYRTKNT